MQLVHNNQSILAKAWDANAPRLETAVLSARNPGRENLLAQAYTELFEPIFPLSNGGEPLEKWQSRLAHANADSRYIISIVGHNLDAPSEKDRQLKGISVGIYYREADVGLLAYNVVSPEARGGGVGHAMVDLRSRAMLDEAKDCGKTLRGVFLECNNPRMIKAEDDVIDPNKRIAMYSRWGATLVPIHYVCPEDSTHKLRNLVLLTFPHPETGAHPDRSDVVAYLHGFYKKHGITIPHRDDDYKNMVRELKTVYPRNALNS